MLIRIQRNSDSVYIDKQNCWGVDDKKKNDKIMKTQKNTKPFYFSSIDELR